MTIISVVYAKKSGSFFDHDYYLHKHVPMVKTLLNAVGLQELRLLRGTELTDGGERAYEMIALLTFDSAERVRTALAEHGRLILEDITNFTDMKATLQINEEVGL